MGLDLFFECTILGIALRYYELDSLQLLLVGLLVYFEVDLATHSSIDLILKSLKLKLLMKKLMSKVLRVTLIITCHISQNFAQGVWMCKDLCIWMTVYMHVYIHLEIVHVHVINILSMSSNEFI